MPVVARTDKEGPRLQSGPDRGSEPFFGVDVEALAAGKTVTIDPSVLGFPVASLNKLPAGDYFVQGMILPYTQFKRSDRHTVALAPQRRSAIGSMPVPARRQASRSRPSRRTRWSYRPASPG